MMTGRDDVLSWEEAYGSPTVTDEHGFDAEAWGVELAFLGGTSGVLERVAAAAEVLERAYAGRDDVLHGHFRHIADSLGRGASLLRQGETSHGWLEAGHAQSHVDAVMGSVTSPGSSSALRGWAMVVGDLLIDLVSNADGWPNSRADFGPADALGCIEQQAAQIADGPDGG